MKAPLRDRAISLLCRSLAQGFDLLRTSRRPPRFLEPPKILVLKPCCLGDVLMSTPAVAALRSHWPEAVIHFGVGRWSRAIMEHNPRIDRLLDMGDLVAGPARLTELMCLAQAIRAGSYDLCLVLDRSPLLGLAVALAGVPHRIGLDSEGRGFAHTQRVPVEGIAHEAEWYLACVRALGIPTQEHPMEFHPTPAARNTTAAMISALGEKAAIIHPAGGANPGMNLGAKRWPADRFAGLARWLVREYHLTVCVVGSQGDRPLADRICHGEDDKHIVNLAGDLSLDELGALLEEATIFIGNDTGAMHMAVAVGTPTVAIFGPSDPRRYGPYAPAGATSSKHVTVWKPPACAPCLVRGRWARDCQEFRCIEGITVEEVQDAVRSILT